MEHWMYVCVVTIWISKNFVVWNGILALKIVFSLPLAFTASPATGKSAWAQQLIPCPFCVRLAYHSWTTTAPHSADCNIFALFFQVVPHRIFKYVHNHGLRANDSIYGWQWQSKVSKVAWRNPDTFSALFFHFTRHWSHNYITAVSFVTFIVNVTDFDSHLSLFYPSCNNDTWS